MTKNNNQSKSIALYFYSLTRIGGAEKMICILANSLELKGFSVLLLSLDNSGSISSFPINDAVSWIKLSFQKGINDKFRRTWKLFYLLRSRSADAIIGFVISCDFTVFMASILAGTKIIVAERNAPSIYYLRYSFLRRWLSFIVMYLCASKIVVQFDSFKYHYPVFLRRRIITINNPVVPAVKFARPDIKNEFGRFVLLYAGRMDNSQKKIDVLIHSFAKIQKMNPDWDLHLVGDGPDLMAIKRLISVYQLEDRIFCFPAIKEIGDRYAKANLFAMSSAWEGFPNALAEALSHGLPAVGFSQCMGVADLIGCTAGWLAPGINSIDSLASTLSLAMGSHAEREVKGRIAKLEMSKYGDNVSMDAWSSLLIELG